MHRIKVHLVCFMQGKRSAMLIVKRKNHKNIGKVIDIEFAEDKRRGSILLTSSDIVVQSCCARENTWDQRTNGFLICLSMIVCCPCVLSQLFLMHISSSSDANEFLNSVYDDNDPYEDDYFLR